MRGRPAAKRKSRRRSPWRKAASTILIAILVGPALIFACYGLVPPPVTPLMLIRAAEGHPYDYRWRPLSRISPHLARSVIAAEDNLFCQHWGFDFHQIREVLRDWEAGENPRGASTISMQTVKNLLLWPERRIARKLLEIWLTPQLELLLTKRRVLEIYLNIVEMGPGIYGAEAAAQRYFGKPAADLTATEAALLAAILPAPHDWSATAPSPYINERVDVIRRRIDQLGPMLDCAVPRSRS